MKRNATIALLVAACGAAPTQNYYVLTPVAAPANAGAAPASGVAAMTIVVEQAHVPQLVDRPQLVISLGDHRVTILEQQRWAEPLRAAIPQVIARDLERELAGARVSVAPQDTIADGTWRLSLDVQRFETRPGSEVIVEVTWMLRRYGAIAQAGNVGIAPGGIAGNAGNAASDAGSPSRSGHASAREPVGTGGYDAIAAAHSKALATISRDIAAAIRMSSSAQTSR